MYILIFCLFIKNNIGSPSPSHESYNHMVYHNIESQTQNISK